jgi:hypothetical protein
MSKELRESLEKNPRLLRKLFGRIPPIYVEVWKDGRKIRIMRDWDGQFMTFSKVKE